MYRYNNILKYFFNITYQSRQNIYIGLPLCSNSAVKSLINDKTNVENWHQNRKERLKNISKSLEFYLENLKEHEKMIEKENIKFENGKRHLANIMGWPSDMLITQVIT